MVVVATVDAILLVVWAVVPTIVLVLAVAIVAAVDTVVDDNKGNSGDMFERLSMGSYGMALIQ